METFYVVLLLGIVLGVVLFELSLRVRIVKLLIKIFRRRW